MKNILTLLLICQTSFFIKQNIIVNHVYLDQIKLSTVADEILILKIFKNYTTIQDLIISEENFFISPGEPAYKGFSVSVIRIDRSGKNLKEIYRSKENKIIRSLGFDNEKKTLFVSHSTQIISIDTYTNKILLEKKIDKNILKIRIFEKKLYVTGYRLTKDHEVYYLDIYDSESLNFIETKKEIKYPIQEKSFRHPTFSSYNDELYLSIGKTNEIYTSKDGFKNPKITFEYIYKNKPENGNILFSLNQGLVGRFAVTSFKYLNNSYIFFYDQNHSKQYLSKKGENSGLYDDIKYTGFYEPKMTNINEFMYSSKKVNNDEISLAIFKIKF